MTLKMTKLITPDEAATALQWLHSFATLKTAAGEFVAIGHPTNNGVRHARIVAALFRGMERYIAALEAQ